MNCKLGKLEIPADQPFLNCKLGREKYAEVLKAIITTYIMSIYNRLLLNIL